ncbi:MAG: hypothetical protein RL648_1562, partial [Verrucomicrobiota bacterium]
TFLFEGWMLMARRAPNLDRGFAFEHWLDYDAEVHAAQRVHLREREVRCDKPVLGWDKDAAVIEQARSIKEAFFAEADIRFTAEPLQQMAVDCAGGLMVANPPYGERMGREEDLGLLYRELGEVSKRVARGGRLLVFTTNRKAARQIRMTADRTWTLFNGALEGVLYRYPIRAAGEIQRQGEDSYSAEET